MITPRNRLFPATFAAFSLFPCPSVLARSALVPTPVPIPLNHELIYRHLSHLVTFCHLVFTPLFSAQKKCAPCHISWTYANRLHTFSWQIFYFNKRKTSSMKLDLRSSATRSLSLYFLFSKKSNEIFLRFTFYNTHQSILF